MNRCRIINGKLKRRFISTPGISSTRPTSDIIKQSVFNVLIHRYSVDFPKTFVIDLFAGSGSLGIEAISCGCQKTLFIDSNSKAIQCIRNNLEVLNIENFAIVLKQDAEKVSDVAFLKFADNFEKVIIFMDPPYLEKSLLESQIIRFSKLFQGMSLLIIAESDEELSIQGMNSSLATHHGSTFVTAFF